jgi:hypothetical protein
MHANSVDAAEVGDKGEDDRLGLEWGDEGETSPDRKRYAGVKKLVLLGHSVAACITGTFI